MAKVDLKIQQHLIGNNHKHWKNLRDPPIAGNRRSPQRPACCRKYLIPPQHRFVMLAQS